MLDSCGGPSDWDEMEACFVGRGGPVAARELDLWLSRRHRCSDSQEVHDFVTRHDHGIMLRMNVADVVSATEWNGRWSGDDPENRHALGDLDKRTDVMDVVEDWAMPPWALAFLFNDLMARMGRIPTWQEVRRFISGAARHRMLSRFARLVGWPGLSPEERERHLRALRWRVGKAYYSWLREVDLFVRLHRIHGLPVRMHMIADTVFKTDLWCGSNLVSVLVRNERYRSGDKGRKRRAEDILSGEHGLRMSSIEVACVPRGGKPQLFAPDEVARLAGHVGQGTDR